MSNIEVQSGNGNGITRTLIEDGKILQIRVPIQYKHRQGRRQIVVVPPSTAENPAGVRSSENEKLVLAIARAHRWLEVIDRGEVESISELAKRLKLDISYVNRMVRFALLAPDIVEAILRGQEPSGLSVRRLCKHIPESWAEQRAISGVASTS